MSSTQGRRDTFLRALQHDKWPQGPRPLLIRLCAVVVETLDASGAAIALADGPTLTLTAAVSGPRGTSLSELEFALGEGPGCDAHVLGVPVYEPDLSGAGPARWPAFAPEALQAGISAVFAFPLRVGGVALGALELSRDLPGPLSGSAVVDGLTLADLAMSIVLYQQAGVMDGDVSTLLVEPDRDRLQVHQATGMVAAMLDVRVVDALALLRAHALASDRSLYSVASDVVARRLRFDP